MIGWLIFGGIVLALVTLAFAGSGQRPHRGVTVDADVLGRQPDTMRNDLGGGGSLG